ncbi:isoaspartyl peptidase/L-asparaginase family protein [Pseudoteredinibacter isoporae]|uniref:Isoaspartyl peptidase n=1 Tax=Pseudoteredinibacter isoporae TaxID=570281 RepID=A0A7X0JVW2_9GAMM|nr:isoaspartyl peptidase/L-asparaginase [Pseudoteredinibacter isoporae]MBB6522764.1 beta-aspartyl-peptidase (threonine type) [Pseudoteredinibacter isoporae]NHO88292.1 isoaspartyl peptidase/L-asparaginase [Pseudoteredinibacter isoporae]NIB23377.1 isoaspartyl peptidase/L-asparaginase [Pseudoteredinibacter isoporae]
MFKTIRHALFCLVLTLGFATNPATADTNVAIVIHGGAGNIKAANLSPEQEARYKEKLQEARDRAYELLANGGKSIDAVILAITILEDSPLFNAGKGAVYNFEGEHDLDASIMEGKQQQAGAVAGVQTVKNPIKLARAVMEKSEHVFLSGRGAEAFAKQEQLELVDNRYFNTEGRYKSLQKAKKALLKTSWHEMDQNPEIDYKMGTVGAVALDKYGNIVAGTSTGGRTAKRFGRIGDSPVIGAGTWADNNSCGVSATGHGEYFIRFNVAADICARVKYQGLSIQEAADQVVRKELADINGSGGVIVLDSQGNVAYSYNSKGMYRAYKRNDTDQHVGIY